MNLYDTEDSIMCNVCGEDFSRLTTQTRRDGAVVCRDCALLDLDDDNRADDAARDEDVGETDDSYALESVFGPDNEAAE